MLLLCMLKSLGKRHCAFSVQLFCLCALWKKVDVIPMFRTEMGEGLYSQLWELRRTSEHCLWKGCVSSKGSLKSLDFKTTSDLLHCHQNCSPEQKTLPTSSAWQPPGSQFTATHAGFSACVFPSPASDNINPVLSIREMTGWTC